MRRKFLLTTISLVSATAIACGHHSIQKSHGDEHKGHEAHHEHHNQKLVIPENAPVPTVDLIVHPDSHGSSPENGNRDASAQGADNGWNLEIQVTNFRFAPENVNQESNYEEGHAHLYINGEKITRLYGNWYYLKELPSQRNEVKVSLNANGHEILTYQGKPIEDLEIINKKI